MKELTKEKKRPSVVKEIRLGENGVVNVTRDNKGNALYKAKDMYRLFGFNRPTAAKDICKHLTSVTIRKSTAPYPAQFIPEPDVVRLLVRSELEDKEKLIENLFEDLLPAVREWAAINIKTEPETEK
jgi:prophage antirepressor-like protein